MNLHLALALGLVAGLGFGLLAETTGSASLLAIAHGVAPLGTLFLNALRMVVIPLVVAVIFSGVARLGDPRKLGRLVGQTLLFFWVSLVPAILLGMGVMYTGLLFFPGTISPEQLPGLAETTPPVLPGFIDFILSLVPSNPFDAAAKGALLPLIVFSALFAAAAGTLAEEPRERLLGLADAISGALIRLVTWILWVAPVGIFGLAAPATAKMGFALLGSLALFVVCVIGGLGVYVALVYLPLARWLGGFAPLRYLRDTLGGTMIAFSATTTVAALPAMLDEARDHLRLPAHIADVVLPLGVSLYRPGTALFQGAAVIFLAHLYHISITPSVVAGAFVGTFLVSLTVAPVPSAGVVTLAPALEAVGVPISGLAILLGIDRIPDMFRSAVNALGHTSTVVVMSRGEKGTIAEDKPN